MMRLLLLLLRLVLLVLLLPMLLHCCLCCCCSEPLLLPAPDPVFERLCCELVLLSEDLLTPTLMTTLSSCFVTSSPPVPAVQFVALLIDLLDAGLFVDVDLGLTIQSSPLLGIDFAAFRTPVPPSPSPPDDVVFFDDCSMSNSLNVRTGLVKTTVVAM